MYPAHSVCRRFPNTLLRHIKSRRLSGQRLQRRCRNFLLHLSFGLNGFVPAHDVSHHCHEHEDDRDDHPDLVLVRGGRMSVLVTGVVMLMGVVMLSHGGLRIRTVESCCKCSWFPRETVPAAPRQNGTGCTRISSPVRIPQFSCTLHVCSFSAIQIG